MCMNCLLAAGRSTGDRWKCICAADGFPKVASNNGDTSCFTACNCTSGIFFFFLKFSECILLVDSLWIME